MPVVVKVASRIFIIQLNTTHIKSCKPQFQLQCELSLAQLSPILFHYIRYSLVAQIGMDDGGEGKKYVKGTFGDTGALKDAKLKPRSRSVSPKKLSHIKCDEILLTGNE